jgi:POT family proton-dependent oligopeptide transporter
MSTSATSSLPVGQPSEPPQRTLFGHPLGLYVLFFTEMWERFSFYGMKTLMVLFMINHFFWSQADSSHLLGLYAMLAYGVNPLGGFIADRYLGARKAVFIGGVLMVIGQFLLVKEELTLFYVGLGFLIAGVGLLKPNISTQVGNLYKPGDPRRDGAFTIFYMGINLGALIGPLLCDWLRIHYGFGIGFGAAGVGMIFGLIVYAIGQTKLVEFNQAAPSEETAGKTRQTSAQAIPHNVVRDRIIVLLIIFLFVFLFWTAFEQSPNAMLVWADKHTNLRLTSTQPPPVALESAIPTTGPVSAPISFWQGVKGWFGNPEMTSGQTQSFNPFFIITLAPLAAFFWLWLDRRGKQPSTPTKMVMGVAAVALAFLVMWPAAIRESGFSSAPLRQLPPQFKVDKEGRVFSEKGEGPDAMLTYYGATRLRYDAGSGTLQMDGVLTDLDRYRLLAESAPKELVDAVDAFAKRTAKQPSGDELIAQLRLVELTQEVLTNLDHLGKLAGTDGEASYREVTLLVQDASDKATELAAKGWSLSTVISSVPGWVGPVVIKEGEGENPKTLLEWDPAKKTLRSWGELMERARVQFLAAAAPRDFKTAVDKVFLESAQYRISVWWLVAFFMVLTCGELCLSPVGLSLVTKLAPPKHVGLFMGGWFFFTALSEYTAQVFGAMWGTMSPTNYFLIFVAMCGVGALLMALLIRPLKRMMHGVH